MIKFKTQTSKNVDDEVIIIYGLPAVVQHHKERAKALALCMGQAYILLFYNRMLPVIRSKGCCTKLNKNKKYVLTQQPLDLKQDVSGYLITGCKHDPWRIQSSREDAPIGRDLSLLFTGRTRSRIWVAYKVSRTSQVSWEHSQLITCDKGAQKSELSSQPRISWYCTICRKLNLTLLVKLSSYF